MHQIKCPPLITTDDKLENTEILRGGRTSRRWDFGTQDCRFETNRSKQTLNFTFRINSKGGGCTDVLLQIGKKDLPAILESLANELPEIAGTLFDCAALANKKLLAELEQVRAKLEGTPGTD